jgi:probable addiction module antidote protein
MTMALKTLPFDAADALDTQEAQAELLTEALASGDAKVIAAALGMIARAKGATQVAREAGISREAVYRATGPDGNPRLATMMAMLQSVGLRLSASPKARAAG